MPIISQFYGIIIQMFFDENGKIEGNTIIWAQGEDIAPENLYYDSTSI